MRTPSPSTAPPRATNSSNAAGRSRPRLRGPLLAGCLALALALSFASAGRADAVLDWTALALDCIRADNSSPTLSTRNLALLHTAVYDAVNSVVRTHQPYRFQLTAPAGTSPEAAAVGAAYEVMLTLYPSLEFWAHDLYDGWVAAALDQATVTNGLELGARIGRAVLDSRSADGASTEVPYIPSDGPGAWQRTPPYFRPPLTPQWRFVTLFCLPEVEAFLPGPPPALDRPEYAVAFNEVKALGGKESRVRTTEQGEIAVFWSDFSYTAMPPGHWHEIAATIAHARGNTLAQNARLFALLSLAQADAAIVCWETKYRYNLWRPVTAIRRAQEDTNPATEQDVAWNHLLAAPPFPAYPSGHSAFSGASAFILSSFFGTDAITFAATSDSLPGTTRTFHSLAACADEVGMSRIYGGIHFQFDNVAGKQCGRRIGEYVAANYLVPNERLPRLAILWNTAKRTLQIHGHVGRTWVLEETGDFLSWRDISTNLVDPRGTEFEAPSQPGAGARFYRLREE